MQWWPALGGCLSTGTRLGPGEGRTISARRRMLQEQASHGGMGLGDGKQHSPGRKGIPAASWSQMEMLSGGRCHRTIGFEFLSVVFAPSTHDVAVGLGGSLNEGGSRNNPNGFNQANSEESPAVLPSWRKRE